MSFLGCLLSDKRHGHVNNKYVSFVDPLNSGSKENKFDYELKKLHKP
jgi:hypothetical protein